MYEVIGHEGLRERLKSVDGSFAVTGPPGVGKKGIVHEWAEGKDYETYVWLNIVQARELAARAQSQPGLTALIDGDSVKNWDPLLKPIEEGYLRVAIWATPTLLPLTLLSRLTLFRVGYLSETEILQILAKNFPTYGPRPWIAKALMGHFDMFNYAYAAVHVFEEINSCLVARSFPKVLKSEPVAVYSCLKLAALARIGVQNLPWTKAGIDVIPEDIAWEILRGPFPVEKHEARNAATIFFGGVTGGRLG